MLTATLSMTVAEEWRRVESVTVGRVPPGQGTPDRFVTVRNGAQPLLRVDVYADDEDASPFSDVSIWHGHAVVGFGHHVHAVSLAQRAVTTIQLDSYFGNLYPTRDYLLVASGVRLFRIEPDVCLGWTSEPLGIDGVVVTDPGPPVIHGQGEWDPPGGWRPFSLSAADGRPVGGFFNNTLRTVRMLLTVLGALFTRRCFKR